METIIVSSKGQTTTFVRSKEHIKWFLGTSSASQLTEVYNIFCVGVKAQDWVINHIAKVDDIWQCIHIDDLTEYMYDNFWAFRNFFVTRYEETI